MAEDFQPSNCWFNNTFSTSSTDWSQNLFSHNSAEMAESMIPEDHSTRSIYQPFLLNPVSPSSSSSSYACSSAPAESGKLRQSIFFSNQHVSPLMQQQTSINQQQFRNNASFWNEAPGFYPTSLSPNLPQLFNPLFDKNSGEHREKSSCESALKRPRIAAPSMLPAFKVKKEKLGDRVAALQQLVSPFGKTDRASVLHEASEYIKFLHDQINVLITPYLKVGHSKKEHKKARKFNDAEESTEELRSRGLCLVPVASTYSVAGENFADILSTQNFGRVFM